MCGSAADDPSMHDVTLVGVADTVEEAIAVMDTVDAVRALVPPTEQEGFEHAVPEDWTITSWSGSFAEKRVDVVLTHRETGSIVQLWLRQKADPGWLLLFLELASRSTMRAYVEPRGASWL